MKSEYSTFVEINRNEEYSLNQMFLEVEVGQQLVTSIPIPHGI